MHRASFLLLLLVACGTSGAPQGAPSGGAKASDAAAGVSPAPSPPQPFAPEVTATRVVFEIDYQAGAEPYVGDNLAFGPQWGLFETNVAKLFEGTGKTIQVPTTLDRMERLDDIAGSDHDANDILAIADRHRAVQTEGDVLSYYVVWLDGYFSEAGARRNDVLGVSVGRGVIGMFKPVIAKSVLPLLPTIPRVVEQAVLVHEVGHAFGLVNHGVPLASAHQDVANGAHCANKDCVMYFSVDGTEAALDFVQKRVLSSNTVLFDDACLADVAAARK